MSLGEAQLAILTINIGINLGNVKCSEEPSIHMETCAPLSKKAWTTLLLWTTSQDTWKEQLCRRLRSQVRSSEHLSRYWLGMESRSKCNLTMVLSLTVQNSLTLLKNGDSSIAQVVLDFPKQMEKLIGELELSRIF